MLAKIAKYEILEKVGVGGFGTVYKGRDPFIKRLVAVKLCASDEDEVRKRFAREAEFTGNLRHPNITTVYDSGISEDGLPYIVQEFLTGEDLDKKIKRRDPLPLLSKVRILIEVAEGLAYAHAASIVHRDIKPSNIRILDDGTVKIMDFGIAKSLVSQSTLTQTGITLGTASYLAPEQIRGEPVDARTDIFSFGVLAYELLTYQKPFAGDHISTVLYKIMNEHPLRPGELVHDVPPVLERIVLKALEKDRTYRFASCADLRDELKSVADSLSGPVIGPTVRTGYEGATVIEPRPGVTGASRSARIDARPAEPTGPRRRDPSGMAPLPPPRPESPTPQPAAAPAPPTSSTHTPSGGERAVPPVTSSRPVRRPSTADVPLAPRPHPSSGRSADLLTAPPADEGGSALRIFLLSLVVLLAVGGSLGYYFLLGPGAKGRSARETPGPATPEPTVAVATMSPPTPAPEVVPTPTEAPTPAPTPVPTPAAAATGTATFTSSIYAKLRLDGQPRGGVPPPLKLTLPAGRHKAVFEVAGFAQVAQEFEVAAGQNVPVRAEFPPRGQLWVTVNPEAAGAEIRLGGKLLGRASGGQLKQMVQAGTHQVEASLPGFLPQTKSVTVPEDDRGTVQFELQRR